MSKQIELSEPIVLEGKVKLQVSSVEIVSREFDEDGNIVVVFSGIAENYSPKEQEPAIASLKRKEPAKQWHLSNKKLGKSLKMALAAMTLHSPAMVGIPKETMEKLSKAARFGEDGKKLKQQTKAEFDGWVLEPVKRDK
jgi:hypothetical protein